MKTTRYFEEQVLRKRPYLRREWIPPPSPIRSPAKLDLTTLETTALPLKAA